MHKSNILRAALAGLFLSLISEATASTIQLSKQSSSSGWNSVFDGGGYQLVSNISNRPGITAAAGGFRLTDGTNDYVLWCLDIGNNLQLPWDYTATDAPWSTGLIEQARLDNITALFQVGYPIVDLASNDQSAGFQLALWELLYETSGQAFDVGSGAWKASSTSGALSFANDLLASLSGPIRQAYKLTFYEAATAGNRRSQSLVGVTPVPLPAGGALLGGGVMALLFLTRRRRSSLAGRGDLSPEGSPITQSTKAARQEIVPMRTR